MKLNTESAVAAWLTPNDVAVNDTAAAVRSRKYFAAAFLVVAAAMVLLFESPVGFTVAVAGMVMVLVKQRVTRRDTQVMYTLLLFLAVMLFGRVLLVLGLFWVLIALLAAGLIAIWARGAK